MAKYRGATHAQRRRINPGYTNPETHQEVISWPAGLCRTCLEDGHQTRLHEGACWKHGRQEVRLVPRGMPLEHLLPPTRGQVVSNIPPEEKQPMGWWKARLRSLDYASTRELYTAVPGPLFTPENGWVV